MLEQGKQDTGKRGFIYCDQIPFKGNLKFSTGVFLTFLPRFFFYIEGYIQETIVSKTERK